MRSPKEHTPVDRADVHGDIERARAIWHLCSSPAPPGAVKNSVSVNDCVLFCTAEYEAEKNSPVLLVLYVRA